MKKLIALFLLIVLAVAPAHAIEPFGKGYFGNLQLKTNSTTVLNTRSYTAGTGITLTDNGPLLPLVISNNGSVGDITSFDMTVPSTLLTVSGVPDTTGAVSVTLGLATGQTANRIFGTDSSGNVSLMAMTSAQLVTHTHAESDVTNLVTDLAAKQPLDADLTTLAGLSGAGQSVRRNAGDTAYELYTATTGTVTTFSASPSSVFDVANATTTPALSLDNQSANTVLAGPSTGAATTPGFRSLVAADIPNIAESQVTNLTTDLAAKQPLDADLTTLAGLSGASKAVRRNSGDTDYELYTPTTGTVTSVAISAPSSLLSVSGSPVTSTGTLALAYATGQTGSRIYGTDSSGNAGLMAMTTAQLVSHSHAESDVTNLTTDLAAKLTNPMTTNGDLITQSSGSPARIAAAAAGKLLRAAGTSTVPAWSTLTMPDTIASGTIFRASSADTLAATAYTMPSSASTAGKVLTSDGTNLVMSTPTFPNASATSGKIIKSDGTNWVASTETYAAPGTSGNVLTSDGTNWTSAAPASSGIASSPFAIRQALITFGGNGAYTNDGIGAITVTGASFGEINNDSAGHFNYVACNTTINNVAGFTSPTFTAFTMGGRIYFHIKTYTSISAIRIHVGLTNNAATQIASTNPTTDSLGFVFDTGASHTNWQAISNDNSGTGTITDTGVAVATSTDYVFCIDFTDTSSVKYYINNSLVVTRTSQLPTAATQLLVAAQVQNLNSPAAGKRLWCGNIRFDER